MIFFKFCYAFNGIIANRHFGRPPAFSKSSHLCKLLLILLMVSSLSTSAKIKEQPINLNLKEVSLITVFDEIKKQSGYGFWYDKADIDLSTKVSISSKGETLKTTLDKLFRDLPYTYEIFDKTIGVKRKPKQSAIPIKTKDISIKGKVTDEKNQALEGVSVRIKGTDKVVTTNNQGEFSLEVPSPTSIVQFSMLGYTPQEQAISANNSFLIRLKEDRANLEEVTVVSTGYQTLSKERATGSFVLVDSALITRSVSTNILDRLDGVTSGLLTTKSSLRGVENKLTIRGRSTLFGEDAPLVILDNFPFEGDIENINPNDVKSITLLKDAAASSIWGTRAGNGVIVITTYKGNYQSKQKIGFNTNFNIGTKPDLYQAPWFSSGQWIDIEQFLFNKGAYNTTINNGYGSISPAVEIMNKRRRNEITSADSLRMITELKQYDVRAQMLEHLYRPSFNQQYALNVSGGSAKNKYFVSAGYDHNKSNDITDSYGRFTLNTNNTYRLLNDRLEISAGITLTTSKSLSNNQAYRQPGSPYEQLIDNSGQHLSVRNGLRMNYVDSVGKGMLLDWHYRPLDELKPRSENVLNSYIINLGADFSIIHGLKLSFLYQVQKQTAAREVDYDEDSFYTRDLINRLSKINYANNTVTSPVQLGNILDLSSSEMKSNKGRLQLSYDNAISQNHQINAIAGLEIRDTNTDRLEQRMYGFNKDLYTNTNSAIDFTKDYPLIYNPASTTRLDARQSSGYVLDRYFSYFANLAYSFKQRYTFTLSARKDESNLFGVKPNQRGVPLWSTGLLWNLGDEEFYKVSWLPQLRLRASFGYSGNVNKSLSAYLTASPDANNVYGVRYHIIVNPPNPSLKWERVKIINVGVDLGTKDNRISGSIEPYLKYGMDLFGDGPLAPQTGMTNFRGNTANTFTKGLDLNINAIILNKGLRWSTNFLFSLAKDRVTEYQVAQGTNSAIITAAGTNPLVGLPYFALYAYKWAGLDQLGDPQAFFNGVPSKDYAGLANSLDRDNIRFMGSSVPTKFGNIRNNISYKSLDFSFNVTYRLGYYFRRNSLNNASVYSTSGFTSDVDFDKQWKKPGDELFTSVPILRYPNLAPRNNIYTYADILVEPADNIRLQDIRLTWRLKGIKWIDKHFSGFQLYCYANQLGYIWKANKYDLDPDAPRPEINITSFRRTLAFGLKADL